MAIRDDVVRAIDGGELAAVVAAVSPALAAHEQARADLAVLADDPTLCPYWWRALEAAGAIPTGGEPPSYDPRTRMVLEQLMRWLGRHAYAPAQAGVIAILQQPAHPLSTWAAHTLFDYGVAGERGAWQMLAELVSRDGAVGFVAVKAAMLLEPRHATERLHRFLGPGGDARVLDAALRILHDDGIPARALYHPGLGVGLLDADPRWPEVLARLTTHRNRGVVELAHTLLHVLPAARRAQAMASLQRRPARPRPRPGQLGGANPRRASALTRARTRAALLRGELEALVERLAGAGYHFLAGDRTLVAPPRDAAALLDELERRVGPLPVVLRALIEQVGAVNLRGSHPAWARPGHLAAPRSPHQHGQEVWRTDPLVLASLDDLLRQIRDADPTTPIVLEVAPDDGHKAGIRGGRPYAFALPCRVADPVLAHEPGGRRLSVHVKHALAWAGLPGFARIDDRPEAFLAEVRAFRHRQ